MIQHTNGREEICRAHPCDGHSCHADLLETKMATSAFPSVDELRASILRHNDTFEALLKIIPARYYVSKEPDEDEVQGEV